MAVFVIYIDHAFMKSSFCSHACVSVIVSVYIYYTVSRKYFSLGVNLYLICNLLIYYLITLLYSSKPEYSWFFFFVIYSVD